MRASAPEFPCKPPPHPHRWRAACRRRGGNPPRPGFPPEGETGKGEILIPRRRRNSYRDRARRLCTHALVVAAPLSVPPCFHTHSPWTRPKPQREPGARCHSVGPGLLSYVVDLRRPAFQLGGGSTSSTQSPGCRRRQSVASVGPQRPPNLLVALYTTLRPLRPWVVPSAAGNSGPR